MSYYILWYFIHSVWPISCFQDLAFDLSLSALLGDNIYNFGELLAHPIVRKSSRQNSVIYFLFPDRTNCILYYWVKELWSSFSNVLMICKNIDLLIYLFYLGVLFNCWHATSLNCLFPFSHLFLPFVDDYHHDMCPQSIKLEQSDCHVGYLMIFFLSKFYFHLNIPTLVTYWTLRMFCRSIVSREQRWSGYTIFFKPLMLDTWFAIKNYVGFIMLLWLHNLH